MNHLLYLFKTSTAAGIWYVQNLVIWDKPVQKTSDKILVQKPVPNTKKREIKKERNQSGDCDLEIVFLTKHKIMLLTKHKLKRIVVARATPRSV